MYFSIFVHNDFSSISEDEISIGLSVKDVQANQATLEWNGRYAHCYNITCSIRSENSGIKGHVQLLEESKTYNISDLTPNTDYSVVCIAERNHTYHSEEVNFRTEEPEFRFMSHSRLQDCTSVCAYYHGIVVFVC